MPGYQMPVGTVAGGANTPSVGQRLRARLQTSGVSIGVALGWQTLSDGTRPLSVSLSSKGGTSLDVWVHAITTVAVGGLVRVVVNGGSFTNEVVAQDPSTLGVGTRLSSLVGTIDLPSTAQSVTYTVTVQGQGVGVLATIAAAPRSTLVVYESAS